MEQRGDMRDMAVWESIALEVGRGFTARQVMDRWFYHLRPGMAREALTAEERRQLLRLSITEFGHWARIAAHIGDGQGRSCGQVKSAVVAMHGKLARLGITLHTPEDVDALPDEFFAKLIPAGPGLSFA
jgi:hypothetical protein